MQYSTQKHYLNYKIYFWHTITGLEVDFVLYGEKGLHAFEIKRSRHIDNKMLKGLKAFKNDYPEAKFYVAYTGTDQLYKKDIEIIPMTALLQKLPDILK